MKIKIFDIILSLILKNENKDTHYKYTCINKTNSVLFSGTIGVFSRAFHLDDATAAILRQNAHHTPAYWWRRDRVMKPISVWG